jgi:nanoRNase/pAp phosphatase (c-di-AMP/oligoRNAs hydrolase)
VGACSTILTQYLQDAGCQLDSKLATALFYGIQTDTRGLSRDTSDQDVAAYFFLQPKIDAESLAKITNAQVPAAYFRSLAATLQSVRIYGSAVVAYIGPTSYPDLAAEMADLLLRLDNARWVICMGEYKRKLFISVRTRDLHTSAYDLIQAIVNEDGTAGGHGMMAGGQILLEERDPAILAEQLRKRALIQLKIPPGMEGRPLVPNQTVD